MSEIILLTPEEIKKLISEVVEEKLKISDHGLTNFNLNNKYEERLLSTKEVCEYLGKSKSTINRMRQSGTLPAYGLDDSVYYKESDILNNLIRIN